MTPYHSASSIRASDGRSSTALDENRSISTGSAIRISTGANMIPPMLEAACAEATLGEICGVLRDEWGTYFETPAF